MNLKFSLVTSSPLCVPLLVEISAGTSSEDIIPNTGVMKGVSSRACVPSDDSLADILARDGTFPEGGRDSEARMESPMFGGSEAVTKNKQEHEKF